MSYAPRFDEPQRPAVPPSADWGVLALLALALLVGFALARQALGAVELVSFQGVQVAVPAGALALSGDTGYGVTTSDGLSVQINQYPAPPVGSADPLVLAQGHSMSQGTGRALFRALSTDLVGVAGRQAAQLEYLYVEDGGTSLFSSDLEVIYGYDLLIAQGDRYTVITLEAPKSQRDAVQAFLPRLISSVRIP